MTRVPQGLKLVTMRSVCVQTGEVKPTMRATALLEKVAQGD